MDAGGGGGGGGSVWKALARGIFQNTPKSLLSHKEYTQLWPFITYTYSNTYSVTPIHRHTITVYARPIFNIND